MTRDEIIKMAHESGLVSYYKQYDDWIDAGPGGQEFVDFAKLVAAKEREACAKVCEDIDFDDWQDRGWDQGTYDCANAIRARGEA